MATPIPLQLSDKELARAARNFVRDERDEIRTLIERLCDRLEDLSEADLAWDALSNQYGDAFTVLALIEELGADLEEARDEVKTLKTQEAA